MTNLTRVTGKTFGETATATGDDPEIGQFGSAKAGTYVGTTDVATIQSLPAWSNGFVDSVTPNTQFPPLPEVTGAMKVLSYQENYLLQKGVAEWDGGTTYYTGDFCKGVGEGKLYVSKIDNNTNHAVTDGNYWEEAQLGGLINVRNNDKLDYWVGTRTQYDSITTKDSNTIYNITDDTDVTLSLLELLYPVGSLYIGSGNLSVCPLSVLGVGTWTLKSANSIVTDVSGIGSTVPVKGNGITLGLTNGTANGGVQTMKYSNGVTRAGELQIYEVNYNTSVGTTGSESASGGAFDNTKTVGLTTDSTKSGIVADLSNVSTTTLTVKIWERTA